MPVSAQIWLEVSHHAAFRVGGWAFVRVDAGGTSGVAGGERHLDAERISLAGLVAALGELAPGASVELFTASSDVLAIPRRLSAAESGEAPPTDNLDLWAPVATTLHRLGVIVRRAELTPRSPTAFAAAWAELARDRAKDRGAFKATIPKSNLAKAGL